jgi:YD repeat-containing protein
LDYFWDHDDYACQVQNPCSDKGLCIRWYAVPDVSGLGDPDPMNFSTCAELNQDALLAAINMERGRIRQSLAERFRDNYLATCGDPDAMEDQLSISYTTADHHYTLYYYDRAGNLIRTTAPRDVSLVAGLNAQKVHDPANVAHEPSSRYHYNSRGQVEWQRTPDGGLTQFFYDLQGRLRISQNQRQDPDQAEAGDQQVPLERFSYTKYDILGRIVEVGEVDDPSLVGQLYLADLSEQLSSDPSWPPTGTSITRTFYSTAFQSSPGVPIAFSDGRPQRYLNNRVSHSYSDVDGLAGTLADRVTTVYSYDVHGNVEWTIQQADGSGRNYLAYTYDLLSGRVLAVNYNEGFPDQFFHRYGYDPDGRLAVAETSTDQVIWDRDAQYAYYDHGPQKRILLGEDKVQGIDQTYTVQGWLKRINDHTLSGLDAGADGITGSVNERVARDAFGMQLAYFEDDFVRPDAPWTTVNSYFTPERNLYNGNISAWAARSAPHPDEAPADYQAYGGVQGFQYQYDALNRLKSTTWQKHDGTTWANDANDQFGETFKYDANGNLVNLTRNAFNTGTQVLMDDFAYSIGVGTTPKDNRLTKLMDNVNVNTPEYGGDIKQFLGSGRYYSYDATGNLTLEQWTDEDGTAASIAIEWNAYGKVQHVDLEDGGELDFVYDAAQRRVAKIHRGPLPLDPATGDDDIYTYYTHDPSGNILATYERRLVPMDGATGYSDITTLNEQTIYGAERLGVRTTGTDPIIVRQVDHELGLPPVEIPVARLFKSEVERLELATGDVHIWGYNMFYKHHTVPNDPAQIPGYYGPDLFTNNSSSLYRAEDVGGTTLFTAHGAEYDYGGGPTDGFYLFDREGDLMVGYQNVSGNSTGAVLSALVPGESNLHYLFTQDNVHRPLLNVVDLSETSVSQGEVQAPYNTSIAITWGGEFKYSRAMAVLDERATPAPSMLYLKRYNFSTTQIIGINLDTWAQSQDLAQSAAILATFSGRDVLDYGEMQVSPDGRYLAMTNRHTDAVFYGFQADHMLHLFRINAADGSLTPLSTHLVEEAAVSSLDFSPESEFLYFITTSTGGGHTAMRVDVPGLTTVEGILKGGTEVRRTTHGHMLMTRGKRVHHVELPDAPLTQPPPAPAVWTSTRPTLFPHVALQPIVIHKEQAVACRHLGRKHYELTDHLGNVRVVVSDLKLSSLDVNNEPSDFTAVVVSRTDYYAFGSLMPSRLYTSTAYRYGWNTQDGTSEISGQGNHYTAQYWEYDSRVARRWNLDPKFTADVSRYAVNGNNPIIYNDPHGDFKTKFGAWLYKLTHGGKIERDGDNGEFYVNRSNMDGTGEIRPWAYDWNGGSSAYSGSGWGHTARSFVAKMLGVNGTASGLMDVGMNSLLQSSAITLTGNMLDKVKNDPDVRRMENTIVAQAQADPRFGNQAFSFPYFKEAQLGGDRGSLNPLDPSSDQTWQVGANPLTWVVRTVTIQAQVEVSAEGVMNITYSFEDHLDLRPERGGKVYFGGKDAPLSGIGERYAPDMYGGGSRPSMYNVATSVLGVPYHDVVGGNDNMKVRAKWSSTR